MGKIKIKHRNPTRHEFTPNDIVINVKNGTLFYKSNFAIFRVQGVQTTLINPAADTVTVNIEQAEHQQVLFNNNSIMDGSNNFKYTFNDLGNGTLANETLELGATMKMGGIFETTNTILLNGTFSTTPTGGGILLGKTPFETFKLKNTFGEVEIGPRDNNSTRFQTNLPKYFFNRRITVDEGIVSSNDEDLKLMCANEPGTTMIKLKNSSSSPEVVIEGDLIAKPKGSNFGKVMAENDVIAFASDKRLKENIIKISNPLDKIQQVRGVYFDWNQKSKEEGFRAAREKNEIGMIAQEVEQIIPQAIEPAPFNKEYKTIKYDRLIPLLVECIKDQQKQIDELKSKIN